MTQPPTCSSPSVQYTPERLTPANGLTLCHDAFGDPEAPPLVLIMGLGAQMVLWPDDFCAALASQGFRVIRFDNRDIGRSTHLDDAGVPDMAALWMAAMQGRSVPVPYTLRDMAADTVGLLDALGIARAHVVGASMGGMIAQELAIHHRERLSSVTSIMSSTGDPGLPPPTPQASAVLMRPALVNPTREQHIADFGAGWRVLRGPVHADQDALDADLGGRIFDRGLNPAGTARQFAAIVASGNRKPGLRAVTTPALVIHGDADPLVNVAAGRDTAESIPGARLQIIEGMGHALPASVWPPVIAAIASLASAASG